MNPGFIGLDIGTQGARAVLINFKGQLISKAKVEFQLTENSRVEQSPEMWWDSTLKLLKKVISECTTSQHISISAISVTSTSGTVIPLNINKEPLSDALMYSDPRSQDVGEECQKAAKLHAMRYTGFNSSSGLSKMVWFCRKFPEKVEKIKHWVHAADFITGKISGIWGVTDFTNALKSGYDLKKEKWPNYLFEDLELNREWMPKVFPSGEILGKMKSELAQDLGLKNSPFVTSGITDGCASQIASGAIKPGDWNTTIGTTLVIKGVTRKEIIDPYGRFYSHKHPENYWMPGGASNTGADWVTESFKKDFDVLEEKALNQIPTSHLSYPLRQKGERFPFIAPNAIGFEPKNISRVGHFVANMEGVAFIEKYAYEIAAELSLEKVNKVFSAGGGSLSESWLKIRSNVLDLPIYRMKWTSGAFGAAVLAASQTHFTNLTEAGTNLIHLDKEIFPEKDLKLQYQEKYQAFKEELINKNYITRN